MPDFWVYVGIADLLSWTGVSLGDASARERVRMAGLLSLEPQVTSFNLFPNCQASNHNYIRDNLEGKTSGRL